MGRISISESLVIGISIIYLSLIIIMKAKKDIDGPTVAHLYKRRGKKKEKGIKNGPHSNSGIRFYERRKKGKEGEGQEGKGSVGKGGRIVTELDS